MEGNIIQIEQAAPTDLNLILNLQKKCFMAEAEANNDYNIPPLHQHLNAIIEEYTNGLILKATINGKIIGSVRGHLKDNIACIGKLIVDEAFQNQGIGKRLMAAIELALSSATSYEIFTGAKSAKNLQLYRKLGYMVFKQQTINSNLALIYLQKNT